MDAAEDRVVTRKLEEAVKEVYGKGMAGFYAPLQIREWEDHL